MGDIPIFTPQKGPVLDMGFDPIPGIVASSKIVIIGATEPLGFQYRVITDREEFEKVVAGVDSRKVDISQVLATEPMRVYFAIRTSNHYSDALKYVVDIGQAVKPFSDGKTLKELSELESFMVHYTFLEKINRFFKNLFKK